MNKTEAIDLLNSKVKTLEEFVSQLDKDISSIEDQLDELLIDKFYDPQDKSIKKKWSETNLKNSTSQTAGSNVLSLEARKKDLETQKIITSQVIKHWVKFVNTISIDSTKVELMNSPLLTDPDFFVLLKNFNVEILEISGSSIGSLTPEIGALTSLVSLDLSSNSITDLPSTIGSLSKLESLILENNLIKELPPELTELNNLKELILTDNKLISLPSNFGQMESLEILDLKFNVELIALPIDFANLRNLQVLLLSDNYPIKKDIPNFLAEVFKLRNLKQLELVNIGIEEIPSSIKQLKNLEDLDLHYNQLSDLPDELANLTSLKNLDICGNHFSKLPESIFELERLESIYAGENQIEYISPNISKLKNLKYLYIGKAGKGLSFETDDFDPTNKIQELPTSIKDLKNLRELDLTGNPLSVPEEILAKITEPEAIISYYFTIKFLGLEKKPIHEAKVIFVGQGSVGKTSIVEQLLYKTFNNNQKKTDGISIAKLIVDEIRLNIWDFGGQEIMHATHQFFLTKRSLYLLVLDSRLTQEENRVEYWLKIIQSFGGESPVLIVGNKIDQHPLDIDRTGLQKKYPNIVGILETSAATGAGIEELKTAITEQVNNLPHVRDLLPETWFTVKIKLEELGKQSNFITHDKYLDLCAENEVSDETSQRTLIGFLHDLGVVLHFQDDPRLEALGILNPQWVTNGVYKILNSDALFRNKGVLTVGMLDEILNLPEYPRGKRLFIVDMMKKFELCYDIEPDKTFLVPDLLPKDQPDLTFNGVPAFEYAYPVLPSSVITRFIVRMNQKIDDGFVWRTGVVLKIGENKALVKADIEDRKITIAIEGLEHTRRDALSAIRFQLDEIHNSIKGLNPQQRVPVPNGPLAEPLKYEYLLKLERAGQETVLVENGNDLVTVNVRQMLSAIETEAKRKEQGNVINNYYTASDGGIIVGRDLSGNLISGNNNKIIQDSYDKIQSADINPELKQTLKSLTEAITTVIQSFPEEKTVKVVKNFERLADEVIQPEPDKQWYSVNIEGLIKAAENLDKLGTPVISLSRKVLSLLTGG